MEGVLFIHVRLIHIHRHNIGDKHMMASQLFHLHNAALDVHRALFDHRYIHHVRLLRGQPGLFPLIHVAPGAHAAVVCRPGHGLRRQVYDELPSFLHHMVGVSFRPDTDGQHRRIRTDGSRPCHRKNIRISFPVSHRHKDSRNRVQHISWFKLSFSHLYRSRLSSIATFPASHTCSVCHPHFLSNA